MAVVEVPTVDRPSIRDLRAKLGLRPVPLPSAESLATADRFARMRDHAFVLFECAAAHLMYAYRLSHSDAVAGFVTEEALHQWAAERKVDFAELADELVAEAADHARRP